MKLTPDSKYHVDALECIGWANSGSRYMDGYAVAPYFRDGIYRGPDEYGIEPVFADLTKARIHEAGNGLPSLGSYCYEPASDTVYRVAWLDSRIETHGPGIGNSVSVLLADCGCAADMDEDEWETMVDYTVVIEGEAAV